MLEEVGQAISYRLWCSVMMLFAALIPKAVTPSTPPHPPFLLPPQDNTLRGIPVPSLLAASGRLLTDNTPEAREAAKKLLAHVRAAFEQTEAAGVAVPKAAEEGAPAPTPWEAYCRAQLPGSTALAVLRAQQ